MELFKKKQKVDPAKDQLIDTGMTAQSYQDLQNAKKAYRLAIGSLSVAVLILTVMVASKKTEVVVMPPDYYEPIIVNGNYANQSYAASHAMNIANLMGNVNERNIDFVTETVIRMLSPHLRTQLVQAFQTEVQILKNRRARQSFYVEDVMFDPKNNIVFVWGNKRTSMIGQAEITERFTYEMRIQPSNGMPKITHFDAYPGIPKSRDPNRVVEIQPYLTRELKLAKLMASDKVTYEQSPADASPAQSSTQTNVNNPPAENAKQEQN